jgi:hypothetical protein
MSTKAGNNEFYALVLDGEVLITSYSKIQCVAAAGKHVGARRPGALLQLVKRYPVQTRKDKVEFSWQNSAGGWRVLPVSEVA